MLSSLATIRHYCFFVGKPNFALSISNPEFFPKCSRSGRFQIARVWNFCTGNVNDFFSVLAVSNKMKQQIDKLVTSHSLFCILFYFFFFTFRFFLSLVDFVFIAAATSYNTQRNKQVKSIYLLGSTNLVSRTDTHTHT